LESSRYTRQEETQEADEMVARAFLLLFAIGLICAAPVEHEKCNVLCPPHPDRPPSVYDIMMQSNPPLDETNSFLTETLMPFVYAGEKITCTCVTRTAT
jgi:hypothetical protein